MIFLGDELRKDITEGKDLSPERPRYLLLPNKKFFQETTNPNYQKYGEIMLNGVSAPALTSTQREKMQRVLYDLIFLEDKEKKQLHRQEL